MSFTSTSAPLSSFALDPVDALENDTTKPLATINEETMSPLHELLKPSRTNSEQSAISSLHNRSTRNSTQNPVFQRSVTDMGLISPPSQKRHDNMMGELKASKIKMSANNDIKVSYIVFNDFVHNSDRSDSHNDTLYRNRYYGWKKTRFQLRICLGQYLYQLV
jgi:hypothetical protein